MEILSIENLSFSYPLAKEPVLKNISFSVNEGEFITLLGSTGSGKSTLLRLIKREISPVGDLSGRILFRGKGTEEIDSATSAQRIGFVMQRPEEQIVCDKVWHELAFGLENLGTDRTLIARRVAEMASYFGIESWYDRNVSELSGGQKQLLNLASVMVMDPDILILDEPTSQLDPIAATSFISTLKKLNDDFSITVIIVEHRLEELIPLSDRLIVLEGGEISEIGSPRDVVSRVGNNPELLSSMPSAVRLFHSQGGEGECPITVKEGRAYIESRLEGTYHSTKEEVYRHSEALALELKGVYFRYGRGLSDVLRGLNLSVYENEIFCVLGSNGSGKTTALGVASGLLKAYSGSVKVFSKPIKEYKNQSLYRECVALLPQDVETVFLYNTVKEELNEVGADTSTLPFDISHLFDKHPYDLSGGEQQLVALSKVLATKPKLLFMDEPTKGLDARRKTELIRIIKKLKKNGVTVVIVTHDVEFTAECADRCAMIFRGQTVSVDTPREFFSQNRFYTTAVSRMCKGLFDGAVTVGELSEILKGSSYEVEK